MLLRIQDDFVRVEGLEIDGSVGKAGVIDNIAGIRVENVTSGDVRIDKVIVHDLATGAAAINKDASGISVSSTVSGAVKISNTIVYELSQLDTDPSSVIYGMKLDSSGTITVHNSAVYDIRNTASTGATYGIRSQGGTNTIKNTYAAACTKRLQATTIRAKGIRPTKSARRTITYVGRCHLRAVSWALNCWCHPPNRQPDLKSRSFFSDSQE